MHFYSLDFYCIIAHESLVTDINDGCTCWCGADEEVLDGVELTYPESNNNYYLLYFIALVGELVG